MGRRAIYDGWEPNPDARHNFATFATSPLHDPPARIAAALRWGESKSDQPTATGSLEPLPTRALMSLPTIKLIIIALLIGGLMIPLLLVYDLTQERQSRYREAVAEIGAAWGGPQTLSGPVVAVPFVPATPARDGPPRYDVFILPETLDVAATLRPEIRYRGPFESVVYTVELRGTGRFVPPSADTLRLPPGELVWRDARILLGVGDARSLQPGAAIAWEGQDLALEPSAQII